MHRVQKSQEYLFHISFKGNPMTILKRADVPKEQTWNRESVFESWDEYQAEYDAIAAKTIITIKNTLYHFPILAFVKNDKLFTP